MDILEEIGSRFIDWYGYTVFDDGVILNKDGTIKKLNVSAKGYLTTNYYYEGRLHCHLAHTVIWRAWNNNTIPKGYEVDHIDNDRKNNRLDNLQLLTKSQNNQKSYDSGNRKFLFGQTNPNSRSRKKLNG